VRAWCACAAGTGCVSYNVGTNARRLADAQNVHLWQARAGQIKAILMRRGDRCYEMAAGNNWRFFTRSGTHSAPAIRRHRNRWRRAASNSFAALAEACCGSRAVTGWNEVPSAGIGRSMPPLLQSTVADAELPRIEVHSLDSGNELSDVSRSTFG